ncbi:hypothetical protein BJX61DRAFT_500924 [Aspergillus egyptiacus]|nr:hypothetical protein BJX61DRAFT_500924 [Aspergillus egyptiacus]
MWSVILASVFPVTQYAIEAQSRNPGGYTDFTISQWTDTGGRLIRIPFLVVETKRATPGDQGDMDRAKDQLKGYLRGHAETAEMGITGKAKLYGAVALGTKVKFFTYNKSDETLKGLLAQRLSYQVRDDAEVIIRRLHHIKERH